MIAKLMALALLQAGGAAGAPPATSVQGAFDAATALSAKGPSDASVAAWQALETRVANNRRTRAIVRARLGAVLYRMDRTDEAGVALRAALADLPATDATLRDDREVTLMDLGLLSQQAIDYAEAARYFAAAETVAQTPSEKFGAILSLVRTATWVDPAVAQAAVARGDALIAANATEPKVKAMLRLYQAELLLAQRDIPGARTAAKAAVTLLGGLTETTDSNDVSARSDAAIAALLAGDTDMARQYMAMTGAGRMPKGGFVNGHGVRSPDCGGEADLKPADMAVVEFSILDNGRVVGTRPVYAAGGGRVGLEFARAVTNWSWSPDEVKTIPLFFRNRMRLEMRCSTAFQRPSIYAYLDAALGRWLDEKGVEMPPLREGVDAVVLPGERATLASVEKASGPSALALVPILHQLSNNVVVPREEANGYAQRAAAIGDAAGAPPLARLALALGVLNTTPGERRGRRHDDTLGMLATQFATDPEARGVVGLMMADNASRGAAQAALRRVADDGALPATSPVRQAALIRLASNAQQAGDPVAARAAFQQSGLPPQACALIDSRPRLLHVGGTFPMEAMRWGFEGWTQVQYDIDPEGRVSDQRVTIAYPPFVFTTAGADTMKGARFAKTYRPDGAPGCGGAIQAVRFSLP